MPLNRTSFLISILHQIWSVFLEYKPSSFSSKITVQDIQSDGGCIYKSSLP